VLRHKPIASFVYPECGDIASPETLVCFYRGTWYHTVDDRSLSRHCSDNIKCETEILILL